MEENTHYNSGVGVVYSSVPLLVSCSCASCRGKKGGGVNIKL